VSFLSFEGLKRKRNADRIVVGSGFLRVPNPRKYATPRSKKVENDTEEAEIYSVSMTHQLHCLVGFTLSNMMASTEKMNREFCAM
jgi:pyridoxal biosynthesis lyase PdxS